jgi:leader peptidase (prepilin peptidase) / N-methyltransferase
MMATVSGLIALAVLVTLIVAAAVIDLRHFIIPDVLNLTLLASGMGASFFSGVVDPVSAVSAVIVGAVMMRSVQIVFRMRRGYEGLGTGDVKFVAAAGAWTGIEGLAPALVVAAAVGLLYVLARYCLADHGDRSTRIAFAPALGVGTFIIVAMQTLSGGSALDLVLTEIGVV